MKVDWKWLGILALGFGLLNGAAENKLPELDPVKAWRKNTAGKEKLFTPVLEQKSIRFGNKTLQFFPDGKIICSTPAGGRIFIGNPSFWLQNGKKTEWFWREKHFDSKKSRFFRDGQKYIWELWYKSPDQPSFCGVNQILEVLPDGRIAFSFRFNMPKPAGERKFSVWSFLIELPEAVWHNQPVDLNGETRTLDRKFKMYGVPPASRAAEWTFGKKDPEKRFSVKIVRPETANMRLYYDGKSGFRLFFKLSSNEGDFNKVYFDFRRGSEQAARDIRGGVDFRAVENMVLPDISHKNLITNPSFERGLEGWHSPSAGHDGTLWNSLQREIKPFELDDKVSFDGRHSLRINIRNGDDYPPRNPNLGPVNIVAEPGVYTLSFYARGESDRTVMLHAWIPNFHRTGRPTRKWVFPVSGTQWKRYQATFEVQSGAPLLFIGFYGRDKEKKGRLWLDAVQLEKGGKMTDFAPPPAEGRLLTSAPDNFLSSKEKIGGRLHITTAKPDAAGKVRITVKNFFGEILLDRTLEFKTGKDRTADAAIPLDGLPGLGVFVVRADYTLEDGSRAYDLHRYARIEYQTEPRLNRTMFSLDYGNTARNWNFLPILERWRKLGVGAKHHVNTRRKEVFDAYFQHGITPSVNSMLSYTRLFNGNDSRVKNFFILGSADTPLSVADPNDPRILVRDFHLDSDGTITPAYLEKLKQAAKTLAMRYPHVLLWGLGGELTAKLPNDWWAKGDTKRDSIRKLALLIKAFAEGVREGNPKAKIFQDDPWNMSPRSGIEETDQLLEECNKLGVRFDVIAIHTYRKCPENPDTDSDAQTLFEVLAKRGYGNTPVIWPEGMHWGPLEIPQWGTVFSASDQEPRTWRGRLLSYDMGWTEKESAAWYMRSWLVALKYADRVLGATAGSTANNCYMDCFLTPYAAQLIPNTLCAILGDARFKKDVRFIPYIRAYIFEDAQKRPVAAVWCHKEEVDNGSADAPIASADFGDILESVKDIMNSDRAFKPGVMKFPISTFPVFFRGKPGTLDRMIAAFEKAKLISGSAVPVVSVSVLPADSRHLNVTLENRTSNEFTGKFNGDPLRIPVLKKIQKLIPAAKTIKADSISRQQGEITVESDTGAKYEYPYDFDALLIKRVPDRATIDTLDWKTLPAVKLTRRVGKTTNSGTFRTGWNQLGLFIEAKIEDPKFVHVEYPERPSRPSRRWENDCLQIYFDTFVNARTRTSKGFDEDDYAYTLFPNGKGDSAQAYRYRMVDSQLGLATQAPKENTFAPDIPCSFTNKDGVLTYRVFFPAKYLVPMKLQQGWVFGFGLFVMDSDRPGSTKGALTTASDGGSCHNRPQVWPMAILVE